MKREEAIKIFNTVLFFGKCDCQKEEIEGCLKMAIKALEQEPILDKIRAEIEEEYDNCYICEWYEDYDYEENDISEFQRVGSVSDILEIIDKYKTESEVQE